MTSMISGTAKLAGWTLASALVTAALVSSPGGLPGVASVRALLGAGDRDVASATPAPSSSALLGAPPAVSTSLFGDQVRLAAARDGNFHTEAEISGVSMPMMVDTGASLVVLSFEQADRLGVLPAPSAFRYVSQTANGRTLFAEITLPYVRVGQVRVYNVTAAVGQRGALGQEGLLGMSFLGKLRSYQVAAGQLTLSN